MDDLSEVDGEQVQYSELVRILKKPIKNVEDTRMLASYFSNIKFFADCRSVLNNEQFSSILKVIEFEQVNKNQLLFHRGDKGNKFYVILKGHTNVVIPRPKGVSLNMTKSYQKYMAKVLQHLYKASQGQPGMLQLAEESVLDTSIPKRDTQKRRNQELNSDVLAALVNKAQQNLSEEDREDYDTERLKPIFEEIKKMEHPPMKITKAKSILGFMMNKVWAEFVKGPKNEFPTGSIDAKMMTPYRGKMYWHNLFLKGLKNMDSEFFTNLLPGQMKVHQYSDGGYFGEIAILGNGMRAAGIYCDEETDFAVLSKKSENDFVFLFRAQNKDQDTLLRSLKPFNWWCQRDKIQALFHYLKKVDKATYQTVIYRKGDPVKGIYLLKDGEVEIILRKPKATDMFNLNDPSKRRDHQYNFRRSIAAPYVFGVEELVTAFQKNKKRRIFDVVVKSLHCTYYWLPIDVDTPDSEYRERLNKSQHGLLQSATRVFMSQQHRFA